MRTAASIFRRFLRLNAKACARLKPLFPHTQAHLDDRWVSIVSVYLNEVAAGGIVLDVGGGKECRFARSGALGNDTKILAVDISGEELQYNNDVHGKLVADVVHSLPVRSCGVDMIVSRSVLEHLRSTEAFIENSSQVLKPNGYFIHLFPCKFAPFALINQFLPQRASQRLVHFFREGSEGRLGFPAYYNNCYPAAIRSLLKKFDFEVTQVHVSYYQSFYYEFFLPLYLLSIAYELFVYFLGAKNLSAHVLVVARKN